MTPQQRLITVPEGTTRPGAKAAQQARKLERLLVVNDSFELKGLITVRTSTNS